MTTQDALMKRNKFVKILYKIYNDEIPLKMPDFLIIPKYKNISYNKYLENFPDLPIAFDNAVAVVENFVLHSKQKNYLVKDYEKLISHDMTSEFNLRIVELRIHFDIDGNIMSVRFIMKERL